MAGSVYTFVANLSRSRNDGEIRTSQGVIELGQSGLFLPAELASALAEGLQLIAGPATSPLFQLTAPSVVAGSSGALTGVYRYRVTFVTAAGETTSGPESSVTLATQQASLSNLPLGSATSGVTARKIYRTAANGASGSEKLAATISDNTTTTATDNLVDGSLGVVLPTSDTSAVLSPGSSAAVQTLYAQLTGNPSDDTYVISAGTGQKLAQSGVSTSSLGGLKQLPAGVRYALNLVDPKYGAVADGVTDNGAAILAVIADAQSLRLPIYAPAAANAYAFSGNITFPDGVDLIGDGISKTAPATRFLCLTSTSRFAFGYSGVGSGIAFGANPKASGSTGARGGMCGNFIVDGNNIATQPLFLGRAEVLHLPLAVFNGAAQPAYNAGTAYTTGQRVLYQGFTFQALQATTGNAPTVTAWVAGAGAFPSVSANWQPVADSAGVVMQYGQNSGYLLLDIEDCAGSAIVLDGGTGGHQISLLEMNNCGSAGAYVMLITQSYATPTVYAQPSKLTIQQPVFDRTPAGALGLLNMTAGADIALHDPEFAANGVSAALYPAVAMVSDGTHTCARLKLRDASIGLDATGSVAFAVASGCSLDHERTVISGGAVAFAYLIQNGALIEEERPVWPTSQALLHGSSTGTLDGACAARHYAPIQGWSPASGSFQWQITELGTARLANVQLAAGNLGSGAGGVLSWGPTTTPPSANPTSSCATWGKNGTIRARTSNGSIRTVAGNVQVQGASYTTVEGDKVVIVTVPAATAVVVTLLLAATAGSGEEVLIRRADNSTGTLTVAPGGSDTISAPGSAQGTTPVSVAAFQVARFVADGSSKWLGI